MKVLTSKFHKKRFLKKIKNMLLQVGEHAKKKKAPYNSASGVSCTVNLQE
jgi:hypothetical protein